MHPRGYGQRRLGTNWFPFVLPCSAPNLPERSAQFFSATYGPRNELLTLPPNLSDGTLVGWGNNAYGQTSVPSSGTFTAIAGGWGHSLVLLDL